jgi:hypothetical protein
VQDNSEKSRRGFWIKIFLTEGAPSGLKILEKSNWTGMGVVCPRPRFSAVKDRPEFQRAGVYLLIGPSESPDIPLAYIGEADPICTRLEQQHAQRDFWTAAYFFTSKDMNLNKAHVQYLEQRLITLAREAKRSKLENSNMPGRPSLSESDEAEMEAFLDEMLLCFPVLGISIFDKPSSFLSDRTILIFTRRGLTAKGYESDDGFIVVKGSQASSTVVDSMQVFAQSLRSDLLSSGVLISRESAFEFTQDYEFSSPSTAAYVVAGASVNGREAWKTKAGVTLKELQETSSRSLSA